MTDENKIPDKEYIDDVEGMGYGWATPCNECVFAQYDGKTQTGCDFGRLDKFKKKGIDIIPAYDLNRNFFVVKTFCNAYRGEKWARNYETEEYIDQVKKESIIKLCYIIIVGDGWNETSVKDTEWHEKQMKALDNTGQAVLNQNIEAASAIIINNSSVPQFDIYHKAHELFNETSVDFYILGMSDDSDNYQCIDEAFKSIDYGFYAVFKSGHEIDPLFSVNINRLLNEDLENISYIKVYDGINGTVVQSSIHRHLYGNIGASLEKKIEETCKEQGVKSLVRSWDEFNDPS